ncbi:MAG: TPM domain-containing protein [Pseudomonadales bacterium]
MNRLNNKDREIINRRIREIESECNAELVTVIAQSSDDYRYIPLLWAALLALMLPGVVSLLNLPLTIGQSYLAQVAAFFVFAALLSWGPIKSHVVPKSVQHRRARRHAHELFFIEGLHLTESRSGVMIFVSLAERYVEIIADQGISSRVNGSVWQEIVDVFIDDVKRDSVADGYVKAINACGVQLQKHFPGSTKNANELPDHLIEI